MKQGNLYFPDLSIYFYFAGEFAYLNQTMSSDCIGTEDNK